MFIGTSEEVDITCIQFS